MMYDSMQNAISKALYFVSMAALVAAFIVAAALPFWVLGSVVCSAVRAADCGRAVQAGHVLGCDWFCP